MIVQTFESLIAHFRGGSPDIPSRPTEEDLIPWRERIDALDRALLQLLNQRAVCANSIGKIKRKLGMPVYVPSREEEVLANVMTANQGPLSDEAVRHLFERVIDETRSLERQLYELEQGAEQHPDVSSEPSEES